MHNRVNEIRRLIRTLRASMLEAEAVMRERINRDEDCAFVAGDILKMRAVMAGLAKERILLGDNEPIVVNSSFLPRRARSAPPVVTWSVKRDPLGTSLAQA